MKNNLKEFKELIETYKSICEEIKAGEYPVYHNHFMLGKTNFETSNCSLCVSALNILKFDRIYEDRESICDYCIWKQNTKVTCSVGGNKETYLAISKARNFDELIIALENRIKRMEEVLW